MSSSQQNKKVTKKIKDLKKLLKNICYEIIKSEQSDILRWKQNWATFQWKKVCAKTSWCKKQFMIYNKDCKIQWLESIDLGLC